MTSTMDVTHVTANADDANGDHVYQVTINDPVSEQFPF